MVTTHCLHPFTDDPPASIPIPPLEAQTLERVCSCLFSFSLPLFSPSLPLSQSAASLTLCFPSQDKYSQVQTPVACHSIQMPRTPWGRTPSGGPSGAGRQLWGIRPPEAAVCPSHSSQHQGLCPGVLDPGWHQKPPRPVSGRPGLGVCSPINKDLLSEDPSLLQVSASALTEARNPRVPLNQWFLVTL